MSMLAETRQKSKYVLNPRKAPLWSTDFQSAGLKLGQDLMEKMGWTPGKGLGSKEQGIVVPLRVSFKSDNKGMGFKGDENDWSEQQEEFDLLLSKLTNETNDNSVSTEKKDIKSLEEKSRLSKARLHYKKFTRGKDMSLYSEHDLACILGTKKEKKMEEKKIEEKKEEKLEQLESKEKCETSFGVTTISGGSIKDYFKKKWTNLKMKTGSNIGNEEIEEKDVTCDQTKFEGKDIDESLNFVENDKSVVSEDKNNKKKRKDKSYKSTVENGSEERNEEGKEYLDAKPEFNESDSDANKTHKKKKKKKHKRDLDFNEGEILQAEFRKKTQEKDFEDAKGLKSDSTDAIEVFQEKVKHKKKKKEKNEDEKTINMNSDEKDVNSGVEEKQKKKKNKHKARDEAEIEVHEKKISEDDCSLGEEYTKKKTRKEKNVINEEIIEVETKDREINFESIHNTDVIEKESMNMKKKGKKKGENNVITEEKSSNEIENYSKDTTKTMKNEEMEKTDSIKENAESDANPKGEVEEEPLKKKRKNKHKNNLNLDSFLEVNKSELVKEESERMCKKKRHNEVIEGDAVANKENKPNLIDNFTEMELPKAKYKKKKDQIEKGSQENGKEEKKNQMSDLIKCFDETKSKKRKKKDKDKTKNSSEDRVTLESNFVEESIETDSKKKKIKKEEEDMETEINSNKQTPKSNLDGESEESRTSKKQKRKGKSKKSEEKAESNKSPKDSAESLEENSVEESGKKKRKHDSKCYQENNLDNIKSELNSTETIENLGTSKKQKQKDKRKKFEEVESNKNHTDNSEERLEKKSIEESGKERKKKGSKGSEESNLDSVRLDSNFSEITESLEKQKKKEKHKKIAEEIVDSEEKDKDGLDEINISESLEVNLIQESGKKKRKKDSKVSEGNNLDNVKPSLNSSEITENLGTSEKQKKKEKHKKVIDKNVESEKKDKDDLGKRNTSESSEENSIEDSGKKRRKKNSKGSEENDFDSIKPDSNSTGMTEEVKTSEKQKKKGKHEKVGDENVESEKKDDAKIFEENLIKDSGKRKRKKEKLKDSEGNLESSLPEISNEAESLKKKRKKESKYEISNENCIESNNKHCKDLEPENKAVLDKSTSSNSTKPNYVVHSHKSEFFRGKSGPVLPENYSNSRVLGLVCGTDFEKFRGSNLTNFVGYGAKNENGKIFNISKSLGCDTQYNLQVVNGEAFDFLNGDKIIFKEILKRFNFDILEKYVRERMRLKKFAIIHTDTCLNCELNLVDSVKHMVVDCPKLRQKIGLN